MTTLEAVTLYRSERAAAITRGVDLKTPQPIPECHHSRHKSWELSQGHAHMRDDAFVVSRPGSR